MKFYIGAGFKNSEMVNNISKKLIEKGWIHTYNWAENILEKETIEDMIKFSKLERQAINDSVVLYSIDGKEFDVENTVNFYQLPEIDKIVGSVEDLVNELTN